MRFAQWRYTIPLRLRSLFRRRDTDQQLDQELRQHIEEKTDYYVAQGISEPEARRIALLDMAGVEQTKEQCRDARRVSWIQDLAQDLRYGVRILQKSPGFTAIAVLTLAIGIGANTTIFSIVDAVLLRALPYSNADQLVLIFNAPQKQPDALSSISYRDFTDVREHNHVFSEMAGNAFHDLTVTGAGEPFIVNTADVTPEIFSLLNTTPLAGRALAPEDGRKGAAPVAVLSESLWRSRFGSNPAAIGKSITLDQRPFTIVGVLPTSFRYPDGAAHQDVWIPVIQDPLFGPLADRPGTRVMGAIARLKPGTSLAQAQAEMNAIAARLAAQYPEQDSGFTIRIQPYRQAVVGNVESPLLILLGAVGLVLLISCANIANLLLSRATSRVREVAVRLALGASRARIVRQMLTESVVLGLFGGVAGIFIAGWAVRILEPYLPPEVAHIGSIHVGGSVLAFALLLSFAAALVFGLAPAILATPMRLQTNIAEGSARSGARSGQYLRSSIAIAEISLAMLLLVAGGLLIRSFANVASVNPGFDANKVVEAEVSLPRFQYSTPQQWTNFSNELLARLHEQPGFEESAFGAPLPMDRQGAAALRFSIVGNAPLPEGKLPAADYATVSPGYFRVLRVPLLRGRLFNEQDSPSRPKVAVISETLAQRFFHNEDPIGRQMKFGFPPNGDVTREIVGVVGDVRDVSLSRQPGPIVYVPFAQEPLWGGEVVVRSSMSEPAVAGGVRQAVHAIDKELPVTDIESLSNALDLSIAQERFRTFLLGSFGLIALILAAIGIFGVISYLVSQRTREVGIRMALGAQRRDIMRLIVGQAIQLALLGVGIGCAAALLLTRFMAGLLYGVSARDPLTFLVVAFVLLAVAVAACCIPAVRAIHVDPMVALRYE